MVKQCRLLEVNRSSLYCRRAGVSREDEEIMKKMAGVSGEALVKRRKDGEAESAGILYTGLMMKQSETERK